MKNVKGFSAGSGEQVSSPTKDQTKNFKSGVSSALSSKQPTEQKKEPEIMNMIETDQEEGKVSEQSTGNLLDIGNDQPLSTDSLSNHPLALAHPEDFAAAKLLDLSNGKKLEVDATNENWKTLIPGNQKEGTIYEDSNIKVLIKLNFTKYDGKIILQLSSKSGEISNIKTSSQIPEQFKMSISDVSMPSLPGDLPKVMVRIMNIEPCIESPKIAFRFDSMGLTNTISFRLPVLLNKFCEGVEMPKEKFSSIWSNFSKVDLILKNPAPSHLSIQEVLKKMAKLLTNCMNLKVLSPDDPTQFTKIQAIGQAIVAKEDLQGYPKNLSDQPGYNIPIMIECEFYPFESTEEFRFSLRSNGNKKVAGPIIELFKFYVCPNQ